MSSSGAAEIHRRGGYAVTFAGNMPGIDILASDLTDSHRVSIQLKTKRSGTWHARFPRDGAECTEDPDESSYWGFVDSGNKHPQYFIAPRRWTRHDIWQVAPVYLASYGQRHGHPREASTMRSPPAGLGSDDTAETSSASSDRPGTVA